jgi:serine/threonine-protein kinase
MGQRPIGPYMIERRLATGGMAEVFVAKRMGPHGFAKRVAFKRILPQFARDPDFVAMFIEEARLAARLDHPNIVQVFDFGELSGQLFLAMELVDGTNVNRVLRAVVRRGEVVPLEAALPIVAQTAHALAYAHAAKDEEGDLLGCVHRDVSPANILLTPEGHVKLTDFGIAKIAGRDATTDDGHVRGKLGYMSPEQVMGRPLSGKSDVFTLSTVFAEMLIAEQLFGDGSELDILLRIRDVDLRVLERSPRRIPKDVFKLITKGLARESADRPDAAAFARACDEVMRRRGLVPGTGAVARLVHRLELVEPSDVVPEEHAPGARMTSLIDTTGVTVQTDHIVNELALPSPALYRVKSPGGRDIGPVNYARLIQMITGGLVRSDTLVSREDGAFVAAQGLPEVARFVTSPALQWKPEEITRADRRGPLAGGELLPVVHAITSKYETGVLHLWDDVRRKKIYFVDGRPDYVASTTKEELLGQYLVAAGLCLPMEIEMALAVMHRYGGRLGDSLVGLGVLRPVELYRAIVAQVRSRYLEAFRWRQGHWAFVPELRCHEETLPLHQTNPELLRDAAMGAPRDGIDAYLGPVRDKVVRPRSSPPAPLSAYRVPEEWERVLSRVRGDTTLGHFVKAVADDVDEDHVHRAVYLGLSCELLRAA